MKKFLILIVTMAAFPVLAQTNGTFFGSIAGYFSSFNTNLDSTFATEHLELAVGVDSTQGGSTPLANSLRLSYTVYQPSNSVTAISIENVVDNSGVAGTVVSDQMGIGFSFIVHDTKLTGYADALYDFQLKAIEAEVGIRVEKALTAHTFAGIGMGVILPQNEQKFQAYTGFTF